MMAKDLFEPGQVFAALRVEASVRDGASTQTYFATDTLSGEKRVLKCVSPDIARRPMPDAAAFHAGVRRLMQARIGGAPIVHSGGIEDGIYWIALQRLEGSPWKQGKKLPFYVAALAEMIPIIDVLGAAHGAYGLLHSDLRLGSLFDTKEGTPHVLGLGVAGLFGMEPDVVRATPLYRSPEQLRGEPVDIRSDIYSAGMILYTRLAGRLPFTSAEHRFLPPAAELFAEIVERGAEGLIPLTAIRGASAEPVWSFFRKATAFRPSDRYQSFRVFESDLASLALMVLNASPEERHFGLWAMMEEYKEQGRQKEADSLYKLQEVRELLASEPRRPGAEAGKAKEVKLAAGVANGVEGEPLAGADADDAVTIPAPPPTMDEPPVSTSKPSAAASPATRGAGEPPDSSAPLSISPGGRRLAIVALIAGSLALVSLLLVWKAPRRDRPPPLARPLLVPVVLDLPAPAPAPSSVPDPRPAPTTPLDAKAEAETRRAAVLEGACRVNLYRCMAMRKRPRR